MANIDLPILGAWYLTSDEDPQPFIVIDCDERTESISIQFEDGYADEIDFDTWESWHPEQAELPDHDFGCPVDDAGYNESVDLLADAVVRGLEEPDTADVSDTDFAA